MDPLPFDDSFSWLLDENADQVGGDLSSSYSAMYEAVGVPHAHHALPSDAAAASSISVPDGRDPSQAELEAQISQAQAMVVRVQTLERAQQNAVRVLRERLVGFESLLQRVLGMERTVRILRDLPSGEFVSCSHWCGPCGVDIALMKLAPCS